LSDSIRSVWAGRCSMSSLAAIGTDLRIVSQPAIDVGSGSATTIIVGPLAIQALATHSLPERRLNFRP
jgi:hypothetical protein